MTSISVTWRSFWRGWSAAGRLWPIVLLVYAVDTALALALTVPPASQIVAAFGRSAMAGDLTGPVSLDLLVELATSTDLTALPWPLYVVAPILSAVVTTFLRGGVLGALAAGAPALRWRKFLDDCARYFPRLLVLSLFVPPGMVLAGLLSVAVGVALSPALRVLEPPLGLAAWAGVLGLPLFLLLTALDYARVSLVLEPSRSVFRHAGRGLWFTLARLPRAALLSLGFGAVAALMAAAYPAAAGLAPLLAGFWGTLLLQQASAFLLSWQRVSMLAGEMALFRAAPRSGWRLGGDPA